MRIFSERERGQRAAAVVRGDSSTETPLDCVNQELATKPRALITPEGFTLLEVMIACGIFFMATFAILALVSGTLRNARALQRGDVDAGMAAAQVYELLKTNRYESGTISGDFGDSYKDCYWDAAWDIDVDGGATNNFLKVDIVVGRRGNRLPVDQMTIWVYAPNARPNMGGGGVRR